MKEGWVRMLLGMRMRKPNAIAPDQIGSHSVMAAKLPIGY